MPALLLSALPYIIGAAFVVGSLYAAKEYVSTHWATKAGIAEGKAELQPKLDSCQADVKRQNDAVAALAAESAAKQAKASKALTKAKDDAKAWEDNALRLQSALTNRKPDGDKTCAGAWSAIRGGK